MIAGTFGEVIQKVIKEVGEDMLAKKFDIEAQTHFHSNAKRAADKAAKEMFDCFTESFQKHLDEAREAL